MNWIRLYDDSFRGGDGGGGVKVTDGGWIKTVILICGNLDHLTCLME